MSKDLEANDKLIDGSTITTEDIIDILALAKNAGIEVIVDGGWCVDALLGMQTRPHNDLDIALEWKNVPRLREILSAAGFKQIKEDNQWNFVLADNFGRKIDVHAFVCDGEGNVVDGITYPAVSLAGNGVIAGQSVKCITPEYMVEFLAPWIGKWPEKYLPAVAALCEKFGIALPKEYQDFKNE